MHFTFGTVVDRIPVYPAVSAAVISGFPELRDADCDEMVARPDRHLS